MHGQQGLPRVQQPDTPCFAATYAVAGMCGDDPISPYMDATFTIVPLPSRTLPTLPQLRQ
jgi:hypothetical protein